MSKTQIFALDIDGKPTLVFDAAGIEDARTICQDATLRADLSILTAEGVPICAVNLRLEARSASPREVDAFEYAVKRAPPSDEPTMAFLIKVDGTVVIAIDHS